MESNHIVCYLGGTCGDLIVALIDPTDVQLDNSKILHNADRTLLKKPHLFQNIQEKDQYLSKVTSTYNSIPSHDLDYHIEKNHNIISIVVTDFDIAIWAAERFQKLHRPHVWQEMSKACGAQTVEDYAQIMLHYSNRVSAYTNNLINLENIVNGTAIDAVEKCIKITLNNTSKEIYKQWLMLNERM